MVTQMAHTVSDITMIPIGLALKANEEPHVGDHYLERDEDYVSEVRHISPMGVDIVLDSQCGENFNKDYHLLKPMGKFILYGTQNPVTGETYRSFGNTHWVSRIFCCGGFCWLNRSLMSVSSGAEARKLAR